MKNFSRLAAVALITAFTGCLVFAMSGYGYQFEWWGLGTAFRLLIPAGAILGVLGLLLAVFYAFKSRKSEQKTSGRWMAVLAAVLGLVVLGNFGYWYLEIEKGYPPIHDITTDTENPPEFVAIVPLRVDAPNQTEYGGEEVAQMQKAYYDDIETLHLDLPPDEAFDRALEAAELQPWHIVGAFKEELRIEAYHKLPWFGFIDDVVIRVDTTEQGSKIDVRSVSRIGRGDLGVNAHRIKEYLNTIE